MKLLTRTEVDELTYRECQQQLKLLTTEYNLDTPLLACWEVVWPVLNELADMILYLEDRIARYENLNIKSMNMTA
jgi:hypothetical protein